MTIHLDNSLDNEDWIKSVAWDLGTAEDWEQMPLEQVRRFMGLPSFTQAPDDVRAVAERRTSP